MSLVHRETDLPLVDGRGRLIVTEAAAHGSVAALRASEGPDGPHEGLVLWGGRQAGEVTIVTTVVVPDTNHGWGHVAMDERQVAGAARVARRHGLGILAQVHSHPGTDTRHSDGDDQLVLMPYEGMFSVVVARYGVDGFVGAGLHQYQDGRWCQIANLHDVLAFVPSVLP